MRDTTVVVGGGIVGSAAAYALARAGVATTLVDDGYAGQATAAGAGIVCPALSHTPPPAWYPLAFAAVADYGPLLARLAEDGQTDTGYAAVGALFVATSADEHARLDEVARTAEDRAAAGVANVGEVRRCSAAEARALFPPLRDDATAVHLTGAARVDGRRLRDALRRAFLLRGGEVVRGSAELAGTPRAAGGVRVNGVRVNGDTIPTERVVLATGAWTDTLLRPFGGRLGVEPQRGQITHLEVREHDTARLPIVQGFGSHYLLAFPGGRVVVGATRETGAGFDYRVTAAGQHEVLGEALRIAPGLGTATLVETRIGFRPASPDGLPVLGAVPNLDGLVVATGLGASGLTLGPYVGALAADLARGARPALDLDAVSPDRLTAAPPA